MTETAYILRILLAAGLSAVIGIEREIHGRPAGLRTHLLVGVGAATAMVAFQAAWNGAGLPNEIGRLAAGVITGIGFLGAGTIIKVGDWVRGLTTAASLWFVAMLGIASGLGVTWIAVGAGAIGLAILAVVDPLASRIPSRIYQALSVTVEGDRQTAIQNELLSCCQDEKMRVTLINWEWDGARKLVTLTYRIRHRRTPDLQAIAQRVSNLDGVIETQVRY